MRFDFKCNCTPPTILLGLRLSLWTQGIFFWWDPKDSDAGRDWGQEEKGTTEDEMAGWHHPLNGQEFG